ncbi:phosphopantetheine-binding protein [Pendulispora albinea]|uniref:Phosphopantetheine-binding protein n=1 Tax=Pendulispora albinea TaxID=2741071 RepID=A0ABZ2LXU3_9BACT
MTIDRGRDMLATGEFPSGEDVEAAVYEGFAKTLDLRRFSRDDDYFQLGGTEATGARLLADLESRFEIEIPISELQANPTPNGLAKRLRAMMGRHE